MPTTDPDRAARPSPDALLAELAQAGHGRLKIFLGAAPGVGKTYEMLVSARRKRADGADLVVGVAETHGRAETQAMLDGLEVIPRRIVPYKGRTLEEMDTDAILARRPEIVLVDELAHTNAPGSRHEKRHQDVEELLEAGIEVWSTLNVQHVESLNDVVAQITRIRVRETVPDRVLDRAEIEVIDLSPEELIERLNEGKVYVPDTAKRALGHYFSQGNLTALRELALRRTAQRVDAQMLGYMRSHAISGPWAAGERLLVCIDDAKGAAQLVRHAKRLADLLRAPWTALYIETVRYAGLDESGRDRIADTLRLAQKLGGTALTLPGEKIVDVVLDHAREANVTQIIIGKSARPRWFELTHGSVVDELVRKAGPIIVQVIAGARETVPPKTVTTRPAAQSLRIVPWLASTALVLAAALLALAVDAVLAVPNVALVFMAAVLVSAQAYGLRPALWATVLSVLLYDYLLSAPRYELDISQPQNLVALFFFTISALLTSGIALRIRSQAQLAQRQAQATGELYAFSRKLAGTVDIYDVLWAAAHQIAAMLRADVVLLLPEGGRLEVLAGYPPEDRLAEADLAAARWSYDHNQAAGHGAPTLPGAARLFLPLRTARGAVGVVGVRRQGEGQLLTPDERRLLDALMDQAALAIERTQLAQGLESSRAPSDIGRLRATTLAAAARDHDQPLANLRETLTRLRDAAARLEPDERERLAAQALNCVDRLARYDANLLALARLDHGVGGGVPGDATAPPVRGLADLAPLPAADAVR